MAADQRKHTNRVKSAPRGAVAGRGRSTSREIPKSHPPLTAKDAIDQIGAMGDLMARGDFLTAAAAVPPGRVLALTAALRRRPLADLERIWATGTLAERCAYFGDNASVRAVLADYLANHATRAVFVSDPKVPARARLQLAEAVYATRSFDEAIELARAILAEAKADAGGADAPAARAASWATGECCYYLARYHARQNSHADAALFCAKALESFSLGSPDRETLLWRIGLVFLVQGHSNWRSGQLIVARARLNVARALLRSTGDVISIGNVEQSLGCILRSQGQYTEALEAFQHARDEYEGPDSQHGQDASAVRHVLNQCRVLTNIGRTAVLCGRWDLANETLTQALAICTLRDAEEDPMWLRQKAEVLVWQSRFLQQPSQFRDIEDAANQSRDAVSLATSVKSRSNLVEAKLSLGHCLALRGDHREGQEVLQEALDAAIDLGVAKLTVSAHLAIAELCCAAPVRDLHAAEGHHASAARLMADAIAGSQRGGQGGARPATRTIADVDGARASQFSEFLRQKALAVRTMIDTAAGKLLLTEEQIGDDARRPGVKTLKLAQVVDQARAWAIEVALRRANYNFQAAARALGISRQALYQLRSRARPQKAGARSRKGRRDPSGHG